jgi:type III pantothenate kinase
MLLVIDTGNTNTVFAVYHNDKWLGQWRMETNSKRTPDEYFVWLLQIMNYENIDIKQIDAAIMSSVVPQANFLIKTLIKKYFNTELLLIGESNLDLGIEIKIDRPKDAGSDRLVNAIAAFDKYKQALIIIDFGTGTTFDIVDGDGNYAGGVIAPGINLSLSALHKAAAKLPNIAIAKPEKVIGTDTISAMQSGIYFGYLGLIEGIVTRVKEEYNKYMIVIATGGLAPLFANATDVIKAVEPDLIIEGLRIIYQRNL